jgi:DNA repair protein RadA/Sms
VRSASQGLIRYAKTTGACVILVGHVTKDGQIAGPRVVEHMVDAVLSFEGDGAHHFRILRSLKNRFGPTDEIGVFEMTGRGLAEVANPSAFFLSGRDANAAGTAVFAGMEGTRPLLVEFQALVAPTALGTPRRAVVGWDANRLAMVIAVLESHAGVRLGQHDVYLNVAGGLKIGEPAADLAAAAALLSSLTGAHLPADTVYFGELGLSGAVRPVIHSSLRLKEAAKLGFASAIAPNLPPATNPPAAKNNGRESDSALPVRSISHITALVADIAAAGSQQQRTKTRSTKAGNPFPHGDGS